MDDPYDNLIETIGDDGRITYIEADEQFYDEDGDAYNEDKPYDEDDELPEPPPEITEDQIVQRIREKIKALERIPHNISVAQVHSRAAGSLYKTPPNPSMNTMKTKHLKYPYMHSGEPACPATVDGYELWKRVGDTNQYRINLMCMDKIWSENVPRPIDPYFLNLAEQARSATVNGFHPREPNDLNFLEVFEPPVVDCPQSEIETVLVKLADPDNYVTPGPNTDRCVKELRSHLSFLLSDTGNWTTDLKNVIDKARNLLSQKKRIIVSNRSVTSFEAKVLAHLLGASMFIPSITFGVKIGGQESKFATAANAILFDALNQGRSLTWLRETFNAVQVDQQPLLLNIAPYGSSPGEKVANFILDKPVGNKFNLGWAEMWVVDSNNEQGFGINAVQCSDGQYKTRFPFGYEKLFLKVALKTGIVKITHEQSALTPIKTIVYSHSASNAAQAFKKLALWLRATKTFRDTSNTTLSMKMFRKRAKHMIDSPGEVTLYTTNGYEQGRGWDGNGMNTNRRLIGTVWKLTSVAEPKRYNIVISDNLEYTYHKELDAKTQRKVVTSFMISKFALIPVGTEGYTQPKSTATASQSFLLNLASVLGSTPYVEIKSYVDNEEWNAPFFLTLSHFTNSCSKGAIWYARKMLKSDLSYQNLVLFGPWVSRIEEDNPTLLSVWYNVANLTYEIAMDYPTTPSLVYLPERKVIKMTLASGTVYEEPVQFPETMTPQPLGTTPGVMLYAGQLVGAKESQKNVFSSVRQSLERGTIHQKDVDSLLALRHAPKRKQDTQYVEDDGVPSTSKQGRFEEDVSLPVLQDESDSDMDL